MSRISLKPKAPLFYAWSFCACLLLIAVSDSEAREARLMGIPVQRDDFIGARVVAAVGPVAMIDMGIAQGLQDATRMWVFRRQESGYQLVGRGEVRQLKSQSSSVVGESSLRFRQDDLLVVSAAELDLWSNEDPLRRAVTQRIARNAFTNRSDSRETIVDGKVLLNERLVEKFRKSEFIGDRIRQLRPNGPAFYELKRLRLVIRERDLTMAPAENLVIDPERIMDPITGRPIGFPIRPAVSSRAERLGLDEDSQDAESTSGAFVTVSEDPDADFRKGIGPYRALREFLASRK